MEKLNGKHFLCSGKNADIGIFQRYLKTKFQFLQNMLLFIIDYTFVESQ